jgi:hypothetical protein
VSGSPGASSASQPARRGSPPSGDETGCVAIGPSGHRSGLISERTRVRGTARIGCSWGTSQCRRTPSALQPGRRLLSAWMA